MPPDPMGQLDVFKHQCIPLCVYCTQIGIFKEVNHICLCCLFVKWGGQWPETVISPFVSGLFPSSTMQW